MARIFLLTGLSGAGKTTLASALLQRLGNGHNFILLDGDMMRRGLCSDLGYTPRDREENLRRLAEMAKLLHAQGYNVLIAAIAPYERARENLARIVGAENLRVIHVSCPLEICIARDPKNNYKKALAGFLPGYTGLGDVYECPQNPDLLLETHKADISSSTEALHRFVTSSC